MYDDDEDEVRYYARRIRPLDLLLMPLVLLHNVVEAVGDWLTDVVLLVKSHDVWQQQQESPLVVTQ